MSNLVDHAQRELATLRNGEPDEMQDEIEKCVLDIVRIFSEQGHSGSSAPYTVAVLEKLLMFEPLTPLTGEDEEWQDVDGRGLKQNRRCGHVFRDDELAWDSEVVIFRDPDGFTYTNYESRREVTFPYTPKREYVDVENLDAP